ncbi:hypothetical protein [Hominibacterium faecale]|uniref:hypothetical protein n=1 Tax=Hominibacterium faecale TaxID=2839743 RepID=UPI0022B29D7D|nr:hypothetical protein [Hominibacterium faecale]
MDATGLDQSINNLEDNLIIGSPKLTNTTITFNGKNNTFFCEDEDNVEIVDSTISFNGNDSIIYLCSNKHKYFLNIALWHKSVCYIGEDNYMNGKLNISLFERKHLLIGDYGLFSFDCWIRTADPHLLFDCNTKKRINPSKSVFLGDHIWVGQHAYLLKGTTIGSGSIIGAMALVAGKKIGSNTCYGGNPAKQLARDVFFTKDCVHGYLQKETQKHLMSKKNNYIYSFSENDTLSFREIERELDNLTSADQKLVYLKEKIRGNTAKNRFFIEEPEPKKSFIREIGAKLRRTKE